MAETNTEKTQQGLNGFFQNEGGNVDNGYMPQMPENSQFYCDAMNDGNINMVLNNVKPELIVLLGFEDYGKSTLIGSIYNYLLTEGNVEGYELYDSDTFAGFERRFYLRNIKNDEEAKSKTLRTVEDDEYLLSLTFYHPALKEKKQLIISDRAGETYKKYVGTKSLIQKDESLPRAQRVLIMIDSTQISDGWDIMQGRFRQLFAGIKEYDKMPKKAIFTILFNKIDQVRANDKMKLAYEEARQSIIDFFAAELGVTAGELDYKELDSKHPRKKIGFEELVKELVKKNETAKNEEQKLKKTLDWVSEKLK